MASIELRNLAEVQAMLSRLASDQIPYAVMTTVNNTAFAVRAQQAQRLPQVFDRPTPLIKGAGRVAAPPEAPTTWTLQGVVKTMRDGAQRGARCTVIHPRARPGDTVTAGAETFELYRLEYRIAPTEAWMEVWEEN